MKEKKPGVALFIGLGPKKKDPMGGGGGFGEESEDSDEDAAISEFVSAIREGKDKKAVSSFKNVMDIMYAKWMDKDGDDEEDEEE